MRASTNTNQFTDFITKVTYTVPDSQLKKWQIFRFRYALGVIIPVMLVQFNVNVYLSILIGILFVAVSEYQFRTSFLKLCVKTKESFIKEDRLSKNMLLLNVVMYMILGGFLIFYANVSENVTNPTVIYGVSILAFAVAVFYAYKYFRSR